MLNGLLGPFILSGATGDAAVSRDTDANRKMIPHVNLIIFSPFV
ncbi:hypothetical protein EC2845650_5046 [Escherichia coli 2845650]|nr:hypothetical protein EC2845650_5046 [Escherichia coli 2845650]